MKILILLLISLNLFSSENKAIKLTNTLHSEQRVALVIGNSNYKKPLTHLNNTIKDAQDINDTLIKRGFDVIYKEDVSTREFSNILEVFYKKIAKGGVGLLYFSGHGLEIDGANYLIPIDADINAKSDIAFTTPLNKILKRLQALNNRLNIVILDACRNDPFAKAIGKGGLAEVKSEGLFVSFATGAGKVASDGKMGENGLFTKSLIKYMKQPLSLQDVFQKAREDVFEESNHAQFPAIYDQTIKGQFFFTIPSLKIKKVNKGLSWIDANRFCQNHNDGNLRLPSIEELLVLMNVNLNYKQDDYESWETWFNQNKDKRNNLREGKVFLQKNYLDLMSIGNSFWIKEGNTALDMEKGIILPNYTNKSNFICILD